MAKLWLPEMSKNLNYTTEETSQIKKSVSTINLKDKFSLLFDTEHAEIIFKNDITEKGVEIKGCFPILFIADKKHCILKDKTEAQSFISYSKIETKNLKINDLVIDFSKSTLEVKTSEFSIIFFTNQMWGWMIWDFEFRTKIEAIEYGGIDCDSWGKKLSCDVKIGNGKSDQIMIEILGYKYQSGDPDDLNWLNARVSVSSKVWVGKTFELNLRTEEFEHLLSQLKNLNGTLKGEVNFQATEGQLEFKMIGNGLGKTEVICKATNSHVPLNALEFEFEIDQTYLGNIISQVEEVIRNFPSIK